MLTGLESWSVLISRELKSQGRRKKACGLATRGKLGAAYRSIFLKGGVQGRVYPAHDTPVGDAPASKQTVICPYSISGFNLYPPAVLKVKNCQMVTPSWKPESRVERRDFSAFDDEIESTGVALCWVRRRVLEN